ncbi:hypothetical protein DID88_001155 [Monilinia fructigena]|uniref:Uncharacterized protein n=1 Tax=Monilinia fructigena TaxID=38457 RepID=A0A395IZ13_9HELO|nr:hypothetical protein DID88_001155 [Monilinia fructigena]
MKIMEPDRELSSGGEESDNEEAIVDDIINENTPWTASNGHARRRSSGAATQISQASTLTHVFPWQYLHDGADEERLPALRRPKNSYYGCAKFI